MLLECVQYVHQLVTYGVRLLFGAEQVVLSGYSGFFSLKMSACSCHKQHYESDGREPKR